MTGVTGVRQGERLKCRVEDMGNWYTATVLVFLMALTPWSSMLEDFNHNNLENSEESSSGPLKVNDILPNWESGSAVISPELPLSGDEVVPVIVLTDRLMTLHEWQIANEILPKQIEHESQILIPAPPTQGILCLLYTSPSPRDS